MITVEEHQKLVEEIYDRFQELNLDAGEGISVLMIATVCAFHSLPFIEAEKERSKEKLIKSFTEALNDDDWVL